MRAFQEGEHEQCLETQPSNRRHPLCGLDQCDRWSNAATKARFGDSGEGGFAYLPGGESELRYNAGDHGHLWGAWYWFSED